MPGISKFRWGTRLCVIALSLLVQSVGCGTSAGNGGASSVGGASNSAGGGGTAPGAGAAAGVPGGGASGNFGVAGSGGAVGGANGGATVDGGLGGSAGSAAAGTAGSSGGGPSDGTLYVSPSGDDANPGTITQPLRTVGKAQTVVRGMTASMTADLTVYLRGGTYPQASTLTFSNADSGQNGFYVKYLAYPGEQPLITGGQPVNGWTLSNAGGIGPKPARTVMSAK
jgi:hypothetical protein